MTNHEEIISGAITSISLFFISIFPTLAEIAKGLDVYIVLFLHILQTIAAITASIVGYYTFKKLVRERHNKTFK